MKHFLTLLTVVLLIACGHATEAVKDAATEGIVRTVQQVPASATQGFATADISIDGMSCMMSCGSAIRKALAGLPGVQSAEIDFNEEEGNDHAKVIYDDRVITDAQLIEAVSAVRNGAYKVTAVEVKLPARNSAGTESEEPAAAKEEHAVNASLPGMILPGIFELLARLVRI